MDHPTPAPAALSVVPRGIALAGLLIGVVGIAACTSVRGIQPTEYLAENNPEVVWVTYADNTVVQVAEPEIKRDTLRGTWPGSRERVKIPLSQIQSVQARVPDHGKTALLATTAGVAAVSVLYFTLISKAGPGGDGTNCGLDARGDPIQTC